MVGVRLTAGLCVIGSWLCVIGYFAHLVWFIDTVAVFAVAVGCRLVS